jgi:SAM-dependent methyltransferase
VGASSATVYDRHVAYYVDFVDAGLRDPGDIRHRLVRRFEALVGERARDAFVLDIACGEGYLSRHFAKLRPRQIVGVDLSDALIEVARQRSADPLSTFRVDDAQSLATVADYTVDVALSQLALMDIADHRAMFGAVRRVLKPGGAFAFSLLHPCFEGPFRLPDEPQFIKDGSGADIAVAVRRYTSEGHWQSGGTGVRGRMGAYHRTLATVINDLIGGGFALERLEEPVSDGEGLSSQVPRSLLVVARRS